jgi:hypothetical protein
MQLKETQDKLVAACHQLTDVIDKIPGAEPAALQIKK